VWIYTLSWDTATAVVVIIVVGTKVAPKRANWLLDVGRLWNSGVHALIFCCLAYYCPLVPWATSYSAEALVCWWVGETIQALAGESAQLLMSFAGFAEAPTFDVNSAWTQPPRWSQHLATFLPWEGGSLLMPFCSMLSVWSLWATYMTLRTRFYGDVEQTTEPDRLLASTAEGAHRAPLTQHHTTSHSIIQLSGNITQS
jgi:hypothetical protein